MADEPIATGSLAKTPLPHLLIYLDQKQLSGTLALWPDVQAEGDNRQDRILLLKGRPVAGRLLEPGKTLREGMLRLFYRGEAPYAFYEGNLLGADERQSGRIDPLSLITESLRATAREAVVEGVLARIGDARLRMQPKVDLARYELLPDERALVDLLMAEPSTARDLIEGSGLPAARGRRLVYLLLISKAVAPYEDPAQATAQAQAAAPPRDAAQAPAPIASPEPAAYATDAPDAELDEAPRAVSEPPPTEPPVYHPSDASSSSSRLERMADIPSPPEGLSPEHAERWQKITTRGRLIENQNYFEMLGVDKNVQSVDVKTEFFKLAKEWHPDRLPAELAPLRPFVEIIFGFLNEAYRALAEEESRLAYLRTVREGGGTPAADRLMQTIIDSAVAYERVQVFARRHQYDEALEALTRILMVTKDEPDYHAMLGYLLMSKHPGADAPTQRILEAFDRAIELHENHEKAHVHKAIFLKRIGRPGEAMKHFKKVVAINPNNVEAAREVRIATMRQEKAASPIAAKSPGGLFGKLLGGGSDKSKKKK